MPFRKALLAVAMALVAGCATTPPAPLGQQDLLDFLRDGATTRDDADLKLGAPSRKFEDGRITTWRLGRDAGGYYLVSPEQAYQSAWRGTTHELVVVFGQDGVVQRHSLVEIRGAGR